MSLHIRVATSQDREGVRDVHLQAFPEGERQLIAELAGNLLNETSRPATIALVAEAGGDIVGHAAFSPVFVHLNEKLVCYILAPLAVKPKHHGIGVGSKLVEHGIKRLAKNEVDVLFVYGDPHYYARFGFEAQKAAIFLPPYQLKYPFGWQATVLHGRSTPERPVQLSCVASLRDPALW